MAGASAGDNLHANPRRMNNDPTGVAWYANSAIIDRMKTFKRFHEGLDAWSGQLGRDHNPAMNPAMKNRLQAIGEIRTQVLRLESVGEFAADIALILKAVRTCQDDFDPMFDTQYGSGRDVHNTMIGLLEAAATEEAFDAGWRNLVG